MATFKIFKEVAVLPSVLEPDAMYLVRTGVGFDLYAVDNTGNFAFKVNSSTAGSAPTNPSFTYTDGQLTRIDYSGGEYKTFTYTNGLLTEMRFSSGAGLLTKTFTYSNGDLVNISEVWA